MRKYKPIKVFSVHFGYGWWWGKHLFFFKTCFAIVPMSFHYKWTDMPKEWYDSIEKEIYSWKLLEKI